MSYLAEEPTDSVLRHLLECLDRKLRDLDPGITPKELEYLSVPLDAAIEKLPEVIDELSKRSDVLPPLYCDIFGLAQKSTCTQLAQKVRTLTEDAQILAVGFFKTIEHYTDLLNVNVDNLSETRRTVHEMRLDFARTELSLLKSMHQRIKG